MASLYCQLALSNHRTGHEGYYSYSWQPNTSDVALSLCHLSEILHEVLDLRFSLIIIKFDDIFYFQSGEIICSQEIIQHLKQRFPKNSEHSKVIRLKFWILTCPQVHVVAVSLFVVVIVMSTF